MIMSGNFINARHFEAKNEGTIFGGVPRENGDFRSLRQRGRSWSPFEVTRVDWHFHIIGNGRVRTCQDESHSDQSAGDALPLFWRNVILCPVSTMFCKN